MSDFQKPDFENIQTEIRKEKAETLGRTGERLERTLSDLAELRKELLSISSAASTSIQRPREESSVVLHEKVERYTRLREQAREIRHHLVIEREAIGLRRHEEVDRQYPMPPPLTLSMILGDEGMR